MGLGSARPDHVRQAVFLFRATALIWRRSTGVRKMAIVEGREGHSGCRCRALPFESYAVASVTSAVAAAMATAAATTARSLAGCTTLTTGVCTAIGTCAGWALALATVVAAASG